MLSGTSLSSIWITNHIYNSLPVSGDPWHRKCKYILTRHQSPRQWIAEHEPCNHATYARLTCKCASRQARIPRQWDKYSAIKARQMQDMNDLGHNLEAMYKLCGLCIMLGVLLYISTISADVVAPEALSPEQSLTNQVQPPLYDNTVRLNLTEVLSNTPTMAVNISSGNNELRADCNGIRYGYHMNSRSCMNALRLIPKTDKQLSFGLRYTPAGLASNMRLPYRWLSR